MLAELEEKIHEWVLEKHTKWHWFNRNYDLLVSKVFCFDLVIGFTGCILWLYIFMKRKKLTIRRSTKIAHCFLMSMKRRLYNSRKLKSV